MSGPLDGKTLSWDVPTDGSDLTIVIGRTPGLHVSIEHDQQVSRTHAHLIYQPSTDRFFLVDKKSRNHTFLSLRREKLEPECAMRSPQTRSFRSGARGCAWRRARIGH